MDPYNFPHKLVFLTGVDGSGKTYFAKKLIEDLNARGIPAVHIWSRFNNILSKPLLAFTRLIGLNYYEYKDSVKVGYHDFEKHPIISSFFVWLQLIDLWIASIIKFWIPIMKKGAVIVSDRGPHDTLIDVTLDTGWKGLPKSSLGRLYLRAIPFPHKIFFIFRDADKIESARPDVRSDRKFQERLRIYLENEENLGFCRINNNGTIEETMSFILEQLCNEEKKSS
jgi:hypothetical protein